MSLIVTPARSAHATLFGFLCERFPHVDAVQWRARFAARRIVDASTGTALAMDAPFRGHLRVQYPREIENEPSIPFAHRVLWRDDLLVVADKPHHLPVVPSGRYVRETLLTRLRESLDLPALTPIHRIDQETAGLVVFCVNAAHRGAYQTLFAAREVDKTYEAIAPSVTLPPQPVRLRLARSQDFMQAVVVDGEPNTETEIALKSTYGVTSHYVLRPRTGARHQLRAVMAHLGAPILNDRIYPTLLPPCAVHDFVNTPPLQLLAKSIAFRDPISGQERVYGTDFTLRVGQSA